MEKTVRNIKQIKIFGLKVFYIFLFAVSSAFATNLLTNGYFETGEWATNWTKNTTTIPDEAFVVQNSTFHAGTYALLISTGKTNSKYNVGLYQDVSVTGGKTYIFKGWVRKNDTNSYAGALALQSGGGGLFWSKSLTPDISTMTTVNSANWQYLEMSTTVAAGVTTMGVGVYVRFQSNSGGYTNVYFDDIVFEEQTTDTTPPAAISNLTALAAGSSLGGRIQLKWTAPGDDGTGPGDASQYLIKYSTKYIGPDDFYAGWVSTYGYFPCGSAGAEELKILTGFSEGTTYFFAIKTQDAAGNWSVWPGTSTNVNPLSFSLPTSSAPAAITTLSALTGGSVGEIDLSWIAPGDDGTTGNITGGKYRIKWATYTIADWNSGSWDDYQNRYALEFATNTVALEQNCRTITGLRQGVTYYFRLQTADEKPNWSPLSNFATAWAQVLYSPAKPTNFTGVALSTTSIKWTWTDNSLNEDGFKIETSTGGVLVSSDTLRADTTFWIETGLTANTSSFAYKLYAVNSAGSASTTTISGAVYTMANSPTNFSVSSTTYNSVFLSWTASPDATCYGISKSTDNFSLNISTIVAFSDNLTATTTAAYNLAPDTTYYFRLWSYNSNGVASSYVETSTKTNPVPVVDIRINEVQFDDPPSPDWVEIYCADDGNNGNGVDISSYVITNDYGTDPKLSTCTTGGSIIIKTGEYAIIYSSYFPGATENSSSDDKNGNGVFEIYSDYGNLVTTDELVILKDSLGNNVDAVCWSDQDGGFNSTKKNSITDMVDAGEWTKVYGSTSDVEQIDCVDVSTNVFSTGNTIKRDSSSTDTNDKADWSVEIDPTPGAINLHRAVLSLNSDSYSGTASRAVITLADSDLNSDPSSKQSVIVKVTSTVDGTGINFTLLETSENSGVFTSEANGINLGFTQSVSVDYEKIKISDGAIITVSYTDPYFGLCFDTAAWITAPVIISEVFIKQGEIWAELRANKDYDISSLMLTDMDGEDHQFSLIASPINVSAGDFIVVHFGGSSAQYIPKGVNDYHIIISTDEMPVSTDNQLVLDTDDDYTNGGFIDAVVWCNNDGTLVSHQKGDAEDLANLGEWLLNGTTYFTESDGVAIDEMKGTVIARSLSTANDNNTKYDWDVRVSSTMGRENGETGSVSLDRTDYFGSLEEAVITVADVNLNQDSSVSETVDVDVYSSTDPTGITVTLVETSADSAVFISTFGFTESWPSDDVNDRVAVVNLSTVTVEYSDACDSSNSTQTITDSATYHLTGVGEIYLDNSLYAGLNAIAYVTVYDDDLNTNSSVAESTPVFLTSDSDTSGIVLIVYEDGIDSNVFRSSFGFTSGSSTQSPPGISVSNNDSISVKYIDADTHGVGSSTKTASAVWQSAFTGYVCFENSVPASTDTFIETGDSLNIMVFDPDLNLNSSSLDVATVTVYSVSADTTGFNVFLAETGVDTSSFTISGNLINFSTSFSSASTNTLWVVDGDTVVVRYIDEKDNTGAVAYAFDYAVWFASIPPSAVTDLTAVSNGSDVTLYWTSPGDDGTNGDIVGGAFEIRYSTDIALSSYQLITVSTSCGAGETIYYTITGLTGSTSYYFAIRVADERGNWSGLSNTATAWLPDNTPPSAITDLTAVLNGSDVTLYWTSPGDDGTIGNLTGKFRIDYATYTKIWSYDTYQIEIDTSNLPPLSSNLYTITGLTEGATYYFRIWAADEIPFWSGISNSASVFIPPVVIPPFTSTGTIAASGSFFETVFSSVEITVSDLDSSGFVVVKVTSSVDSSGITFQLTETSTGVFSGWLVFSTSTSVNNSSIEVADGSTITVSYFDIPSGTKTVSFIYRAMKTSENFIYVEENPPGTSDRIIGEIQSVNPGVAVYVSSSPTASAFISSTTANSDGSFVLDFGDYYNGNGYSTVYVWAGDSLISVSRSNDIVCDVNSNLIVFNTNPWGTSPDYLTGSAGSVESSATVKVATSLSELSAASVSAFAVFYSTADNSGSFNIQIGDAYRKYNQVFVRVTDTAGNYSEFSVNATAGSVNLYPPAPNPFKVDRDGYMVFMYDLQNAATVKIKIFSISGELVWDYTETQSAGANIKTRWYGEDMDGKKVSSGVYIYHFEAGSFTKKGKIILIR